MKRQSPTRNSRRSPRRLKPRLTENKAYLSVSCTKGGSIENYLSLQQHHGGLTLKFVPFSQLLVVSHDNTPTAVQKLTLSCPKAFVFSSVVAAAVVIALAATGKLTPSSGGGSSLSLSFGSLPSSGGGSGRRMRRLSQVAADTPQSTHQYSYAVLDSFSVIVKEIGVIASSSQNKPIFQGSETVTLTSTSSEIPLTSAVDITPGTCECT